MNKIYTQKKKIFLGFIFLCIVFYFIFSYSKSIQNTKYGVSFNAVYAKELGLNWKEVYNALFEDLNVKRVRLSAHWNSVEANRDTYNFEELDYQVNTASKYNAEIILAVGKRLPRWPECHVPNWAGEISKEEQEKEILQYIEKTVTRYKNYENIKIWQVENEPFLSIYASDFCKNFDEDFLEKEITLVKSLDPTQRPILITDSGELSTWRKAFSHGDIFGTTVYVYSWNKIMGDFRNPFLPGFYSFRSNLLNLFTQEKKESIIAELSLEPWLDKSILQEKIDIQKHRMSYEKFDTVIDFAKKTGMETQYLWGVEWWYYMKLQGDSWYWERVKQLFK